MGLERQVAFWVVALAIFAALLWLLSPVLLPFVAGMALAYLLDPVARRAEEFGVGRGISALIILSLVLVIVVVGAVTVAPVLADQVATFADNLPGYVTKLQAVLTDPSHPWLAKIFGGKLADPSKSVSGIVSQGSGF